MTRAHIVPSGSKPTSSRFGRTAATALIAMAALVGCQSGGSESSVDYGGSSADYSETGYSSEEAAAEGATAAPADAGTAQSETVIVTGRATVRVDDPETALTDLATAVTSVGGIVESSSLTVRGEDPYGTLVMRIPADEYQKFVDDLATHGEILDKETSTEEVGKQIADVTARIAALETSIERLTEMLTQTESVTELLEVEAMITSRQAELDGLRAQLEWLEDQVAMSTLTVDLTTRSDGSTYTSGPSTLERAWTYFTDSLQGTLYFIAIALPWLLVAGVLTALVLPFIRRRRARVATPSPANTESAPTAGGLAMFESETETEAGSGTSEEPPAPHRETSG